MKAVLTKLVVFTGAVLVLAGCSASTAETAPAPATAAAASDTNDDAVTFINVFEIPEDEIDTFIATWKERSRFTTTAEGFISAELHRAIGPDTEFKLVNVTKWESVADFEAATNDPEFRAELDKYQFSEDSTWTAHGGFYNTAAIFD